MSAADYVIRVLNSPLDIAASDWNALLAVQTQSSPFMRHEYLAAMHRSGCAVTQTGWTPRFITLWRRAASDGSRQEQLCAACAAYLKTHSRGEYVFDWAWANAYAEHGLAYYPKALVATPFTPVPGARLLARDTHARGALLHALLQWCREEALSSLHLLFLDEEDEAASVQAGLMLRHNVQFHWTNVAPLCSSLVPTPERVGATGPPFRDFDDFLSSLTQDKRKKIRQERRKVSDAGVTVRWARGRDIRVQDWDFFYHCYERTYLEHGNAPYLNRSFFQSMADTLAQNWLLFVAERGGVPVASSLIALSDDPPVQTDDASPSGAPPQVAYGRYWGAIQRVDCLHFELCYYQPLQWCIAHGVQRFEGGAQGEHKMARALLPVKTTSAHWLAQPAFADAVHRFLAREEQGIDAYLLDLQQRSPLRRDS